MIAAVCFDLFETLVTEYIADYQPTPSLAQRLQIDPKQLAHAWTALTPARFRGELPDYPAALRALCHRVGSPVTEDLIAQLHKELLLQKVRPFAHVDHRIMAMLSTLRQHGFKLGLISNASSEEVAAWQHSALACAFDVTIFSYAVGWIKPEPEIYWMTCEALEVEPNATLFIGDGSSDELMGAKRAGLMPYWATWFLDQWPNAKQSPQQRQENEQFVRLAAPSDLFAVVDELLQN
jgi:putative hydrolase of the HAD superfamily